MPHPSSLVAHIKNVCTLFALISNPGVFSGVFQVQILWHGAYLRPGAYRKYSTSYQRITNRLLCEVKTELKIISKLR